MAKSTAISVEEYLHTSYRPDCDYVDGELVERNVGEYSHSTVQGFLLKILFALESALSIRARPELRIRVSPTRFRIPDITVMLKSQHIEPVPSTPPFLCIEVVSPEDRMSRIVERVKEYLAFGVKYVWVIDPAPPSRSAYCYTADEGREVRDQLTTQNPDISISVPELFAELDKDLRDEA